MKLIREGEQAVIEDFFDCAVQRGVISEGAGGELHEVLVAETGFAGVGAEGGTDVGADLGEEGDDVDGFVEPGGVESVLDGVGVAFGRTGAGSATTSGHSGALLPSEAGYRGWAGGLRGVWR